MFALLDAFSESDWAGHRKRHVHGDRDPLCPVELALDLYRAILRLPCGCTERWTRPLFGASAAPFVEAALAHLRPQQ